MNLIILKFHSEFIVFKKHNDQSLSLSLIIFLKNSLLRYGKYRPTMFLEGNTGAITFNVCVGGA